MFGKFKKMFGGNNEVEELIIAAPVAGKAVPVEQVNDPTFSEGLLGRGIAILPQSNRVVSPVNGTISLMFDTGHAATILSDDGIEVLVHIGLDTISLKGKHYTKHAKTGDKVAVGDLLMEFDREAITVDGFDTITPVVVTNPDDFEEITMVENQDVEELTPIIRLRKKS